MANITKAIDFSGLVGKEKLRKERVAAGRAAKKMTSEAAEEKKTEKSADEKKPEEPANGQEDKQ